MNSQIIGIGTRAEAILNPESFGDFIEEYMGREASVYYRQTIEELREELLEAKKGLNSDFLSYENDLDCDAAAFHDIRDLCEEMLEDISKENGRNRKAAVAPYQKKIKEILKIIENQI